MSPYTAHRFSCMWACADRIGNVVGKPERVFYAQITFYYITLLIFLHRIKYKHNAKDTSHHQQPPPTIILNKEIG